MKKLPLPKGKPIELKLPYIKTLKMCKHVNMGYMISYNNDNEIYLSTVTNNRVKKVAEMFNIKFDSIYIIPVATCGDEHRCSYLITGKDKSGNNVAYVRRETYSATAGQTCFYHPGFKFRVTMMIDITGEGCRLDFQCKHMVDLMQEHGMITKEDAFLLCL